jgi:uncharacterized membrane protein
MLIALVALAGIFVALYLALYKLGYIGQLVCAVGSCEKVQTSKWASLFGIPIAIWGVGYYVGILAIALAGLSASLADRRSVSLLLLALTTFGLLFSGWLTYLELAVIDAICQWCVISAILAAVLFVLSWLDVRDVTQWNEELALEAADRLREGRFGDSIRNTAEVSTRALRDD